ncbi:hypothetical protein [Thiolapillus sp.]
MSLIRYLVILLALGFMGAVTAELWPQLQAMDFRLQAAPTIISLVLLVILFMLDGYGWLRILATLNHHPPALDSIRIWLLSSVTRYLPGGIWSYVSRAEMTHKQGIDLPSISVALYLETMLLAATSLVAGLPALIIAGGYQPQWWHVLLFSIATMLSFHPASLRLLRRLPGKMGVSFARVSLPGFSQMAGLYIYYLLFWGLFGIAFVVFVDMLHPIPGHLWLATGSSIALSFFAGFVIIFVPGGIGVRESVIYLLLEPLISAPGALLISLGSRAWIMAGEALSLAIMEAVFQRRKLRS